MVTRLATVCCVALLGLASPAHAQVDNTGVLDQALKQFRTAAEGWQNAAQGAATTLFWSLAAISLVWTLGQLVLRRAELGELFGEVIRYLLFTGFWFWMLSNGPSHARLIMDSMVQVAGQTSGQHMVTPSAIVDIGFHLVDRALTQSTILSPLDSAFGIVLALGILVILALVAVNMLVTVIACWIVAYGGLIVLGFGGSRWTSDMAINYYKMVLSLALQVMAMVLLVGIGESLLRSYYGALQQDVGLHEQAVLLVVAIVLLVTVNRVPVLIGSLANGSSPHYALGGGAGAGAAMSALSTAGAVAATGAAVASGGAAAVFSGAKALLGGAGEVAKATMAAQRNAQAEMSSMFADFGGRAAVSLLGGDSSSGGDHSSGRSGGGSVFPAALTDTAAASSTGDSAQGIRFDEHDDSSSAERPAANEGGQQPDAVKGPGDDRDAAASSSARSTETGLDPRPSSDELAEEASSSPRSEAIEQRSGQDGTARPSGDAQPQCESSGKGTAAGTASSPKAGASSSASERRAAGEATSSVPAGPAPTSSAATSPPPAGAFASSPPAVSPPAREVGAVPPPAGGGRQPMWQSAAAAPGSALASASQQAVVPQDIPFSSSTGAPERRNLPKEVLNSAPPTAAERAELPAAYSMQTSVDVEAEVAAFRDRD